MENNCSMLQSGYKHAYELSAAILLSASLVCTLPAQHLLSSGNCTLVCLKDGYFGSSLEM